MKLMKVVCAKIKSGQSTSLLFSGVLRVPFHSKRSGNPITSCNDCTKRSVINENTVPVDPTLTNVVAVSS